MVNMEHESNDFPPMLTCQSHGPKSWAPDTLKSKDLWLFHLDRENGREEWLGVLIIKACSEPTPDKKRRKENILACQP